MRFLFLFLATAAFADVNIVTSKTWRVDGAVDLGPNPRSINVVVDGVPVGVFSELKVFFSLSRTNTPQVFGVRGSGTILPLVPPPVTTGGVFRLTSYRDCDAGFVGPVVITDLEFKTPKGSNPVMKVTGRVSNLDSLGADDLKLSFMPPNTNTVLLALQYKLRALRNVCVDQSLHDTQDVFRVAEVDTATNEVTRLHYLRNADKVCDVGDCVRVKEFFCADLDGVPGYLLGKPRSLGDGAVVLLHTNAIPQNTPSLGVLFSSPPHGRIKPQILTGAVGDVALWGNWVDVKDSYLAGKTVTKVKLTLGAQSPGNAGCDTIRLP